jgi:hypothetical protein
MYGMTEGLRRALPNHSEESESDAKTQDLIEQLYVTIAANTYASFKLASNLERTRVFNNQSDYYKWQNMTIVLLNSVQDGFIAVRHGAVEIIDIIL